MDLETQRSVLRRLLDLHREGATSMAGAVRRQPVGAYVDAERLEREHRILFREHPLVVGLSADLPESGAYRALDLAGVPVLLVRGEDGVARAFLNACRHRGSRVAEGAGVTDRVFKCQYHAWCYDVHGRLLGQPTAQQAFAEVPAEELGLVPLPVAEAGGLLFVTPSAAAPAIDGRSHLAGLAPELANFGFEGFTLFAEQHHEIRSNWKQPYETFLETYHVFGLHRTTLAKQLLSTPMLADFHGPHGRGVIMGRETAKHLERDEAEWRLRDTANLVYWIFPNAVLSLPKSGHAELWLVAPVPGDPGRCHVHFKFYVPSAEAESRAGFWDKMVSYTSTIVLGEDFSQQVRIHEALASGSHPGLVFGRNEPALIHFHEAIDSALA